MKQVKTPQKHPKDQKTKIGFNDTKILNSKFQKHVHTTLISFSSIEILSSKFKDISRKLMSTTTMMKLGA